MTQAVGIEVYDEDTGEWHPAGEYIHDRDDFTGYRKTVRLVFYSDARERTRLPSHPVRDRREQP